ncbi:hypothetical protein DB35_26390 [Streptomyces abyssalis]|uniref:Uncharacterized protein n=1 Tax=Streptomyces abyssalis TaxID=933944 RepID=A0A1E7JME1_9ACTN|nr:hypothetical protein [Streptomyces abyssalis]OEU87072.1 hypothetical protein DB35_26390 [Streptomyces abyssalis]OEU89039.1 hypothetical protein AN215_14940 [Streptomyces abyssalis]
MRKNRALGVAAALALAVVAGGGWTAQADSAPEGKPKGHGKIYGYEVVSLPNENVGNFERRTVWCPKGKKVLGGGAEARGEGAELVGSFPTDNHRGWIGLGNQDEFDSVGISVFAICAYTR